MVYHFKIVTLILVIFMKSMSAETVAKEVDKSDIYEFEPLTITEKKTEKNPAKSAFSIALIDEQEIEDSGITGISDLFIRVPNLTIQDTPGNFTFIHIRGVAPVDADLSSAAVYLDEVNYLDVNGLGNVFYDLESIEILRGPQSVVYGAQASSGVLKISSHQPSNKPSAHLEITLGERDLQSYESTMNVPLVKDRLLLRLSGVRTREDGFIENELTGNLINEVDELSGRAILRWLPTDRTDLTVTVAGDHLPNNGPPFITNPLGDVDARKVRADYDVFKVELDTIYPSLRIVHQWDQIELTFIGAYAKTVRKINTDLDFTEADLLRRNDRNEKEQFTQDLRLNSTSSDGLWEWSLGFFSFQKNFNEVDDREVRPGATPNPFVNVLEDDGEGHGEAIFGYGAYSFFERLEISMALRYEQEYKSVDSINFNDVDGIPMDVARIDFSETFSEWLPSISVRYEWRDSFVSYGSAARGFRSGGINTLGTNARGEGYDPEKSWNYELGLKSTWFDDRFSLNLTLFYLEIDDLQVAQGLTTDLVIRSAGKGRSRGIELETLARPVDNFEIIADWGFSDTEYLDFIDPDSGSDFSGNRIAGAPNYNFTVAAQYRHELSKSFTFFLRLEYQGAGRIYFDESNERRENPYQLWNLRAGLESKRLALYLLGKNLTDEEYLLRIFDLPVDTVGEFGPPKTIGGTLVCYF